MRSMRAWTMLSSFTLQMPMKVATSATMSATHVLRVALVAPSEVLVESTVFIGSISIFNPTKCDAYRPRSHAAAAVTIGNPSKPI